VEGNGGGLMELIPRICLKRERKTMKNQSG
jgi:hypothetical protein